LLDDGAAVGRDASPTGRAEAQHRPAHHAGEEADPADDHEDDPDGIEVDAVGLALDGKCEDGGLTTTKRAGGSAEVTPNR